MKKIIDEVKELVELKDRYKEIINSAKDGIFLKDTGGRYLLINHAAASMVGKKVSDFIDKTDVDVFSKTDAKKIITMDKRVLKTKRTYKFEERFSLNGDYIYLETIKYPILDSNGRAKYLCGLIRDITGWKKNESILADAMSELRALYQISKDMESIENLQDLFSDIVSISCRAMSFSDPYLVIWFYEANRKVVKAFGGVDTAVTAHKIMARRNNFTAQIRIGSKAEGGVAAGYKDQRVKLPREEKEFIKEVADIIGREIERRKVKDDLSRMFIEVVKTLSAALDARDHYTVDHSKRISSSCRFIAEKIGLKKKEIDNIVMGALLHDIGKIGISDGILGKPSRLTKEEFDKVKQHPLISENILKPIDALKGTLDMIRHHHERYDGKGYPNGLKGNKIPIAARILCVCDSYDAMVSERPYRKAMSVRRAVKELNSCSGTQFDPKMAKLMIEIINKGIFQ